MQTSIEWLVTELNKELNYIPITQWDRIRDIVHKAKEMHKQEIVDAYNQGASDAYPNGSYIEGNTYYQETFKKQ
ncbi:MAG: hypothetical protein ACK52I_30950 [Pseudomonadota bacterium]